MDNLLSKDVREYLELLPTSSEPLSVSQGENFGKFMAEMFTAVAPPTKVQAYKTRRGAATAVGG